MKLTFLLLASLITSSVSAQTASKDEGGAAPEVVVPAPELPADGALNGSGQTSPQPPILPAGPDQLGGQQQLGGPQIPPRQPDRPAQPALELATVGDLVKCPIIDRSVEVRRSIAPSAEQIRTELQAAVTRASQSRNPQCQTAGQSLGNLVAGFSGSGGSSTCERSPQTCAGYLRDVLPLLDLCTEDRESLADMTTSIALNLTAGSPAGIVALGVSAVRTIISLFSGRSERRAQRAEERRIAQQRREVIEAAASCAMMTFYQVGVCAPGAAGRVRDILDNLQPSPTCTNREGLGNMSIGQKVTAISNLDACASAPSADMNACFSRIGQQFTPAVTGSALPPERAACLAEEVVGISANVASFRTRDIPDFLKLARRHHTQQIVQIRNRLAASESADLSGSADRSSLILHCFYGKMSRSISSQNPERALADGELAAQDRVDTGRGGILRDVPENDRVLLADNAAEVDRICNNLDNCFRTNPNLPTVGTTFGPATASLSQRMCNGVGRFLDYGSNTLDGRVGSMERAVGRGGTYGQNCSQQPGRTSGDGAETSVQ